MVFSKDISTTPPTRLSSGANCCSIMSSKGLLTSSSSEILYSEASLTQFIISGTESPASHLATLCRDTEMISAMASRV